MKISECMTQPVEVISSSETIKGAAQKMAECDCGILPVAEDDKLIGMVTDRDIAIRGVALGKSADDSVSEIMSSEVLYCRDDAEIEDVLANMGDIQVRRLPVVDGSDQLVGIVSLGDVSNKSSPLSGNALAEISRHTGVHSQSI